MTIDIDAGGADLGEKEEVGEKQEDNQALREGSQLRGTWIHPSFTCLIPPSSLLLTTTIPMQAPTAPTPT